MGETEKGGIEPGVNPSGHFPGPVLSLVPPDGGQRVADDMYIVMIDEKPPRRTTLDTLVKRHPEVIGRRVEGEIVLVHLTTNLIYNLNASGSKLWELLESTMSLSDCVRSLLLEYDVAPEVLEQDVTDLVQELARLKLLIVETAPA